MLLYYITDRLSFPGDESSRRRCLLDKIAEAADHGIDYIQLREKDLSARDQASLAREAIHIIHSRVKLSTPATTLLINSRIDVALAARADGVHLPANYISPQEVTSAWRGAGSLVRELSPRSPQIAVSCHSIQEVAQAAANAAAFAVFGPVFEKKDVPAAKSTGLNALREACQTKIPVLALGGVTRQNACSCLEVGAAGIAGIRLFQENDISTLVHQLRG
jgi:thiamine-phosphate pyrophosphorylase